MRFLLISFLFFTSLIYAQEDAWVYFQDKPNAQYYLDNPLLMLSQRALNRRTQQNISLNFQDAPLHQAYIDQIAGSSGITVKAKSKWLNALHVRGTQLDIANLTNFPFVNSIVYANHALNGTGRMASNKPNQKVNKFLDVQTNYNYGNSALQIQMLNAHFLHQQNHTGAGKIIAVMDAGFPGVNTQAPFQYLFQNNLILGGYDFVLGTSNPYTGFQHGTQVLSTMGGFVDGQLVGTAPNAQYYLFRTEDAASENPVEESYWVEALEMADSLGVDVVNTSLGYFEYDNPNYSYTYADMNGQVGFSSKAATIAFSKGMICVTSAGNSGTTSEPHIGVPADAVNNLAIGAVNSSEIKAGFSSIGPTADNRIKPDLMALGVAATVSNQAGVITTNSGTSFASPILAGAIASFWSAFPNKTNVEIVQLIKQSADYFSNPNNNYGYGIPDFQLAYNNALLSIDSNTLKAKTILYPNPFQDKISVSLPDNVVKGEIKLINNLGQTVLTKSITNNEIIAVEGLNTGLYIYTITYDNFSESGKLIKK